MTQPPPESTTPDDIEAALQSLRSSVGAPPPPPIAEEVPPPPPERRRRRGWGRFLGLLILAGLAGGLAVLFIPALNQRSSAADNIARGRLAELEARIDKLTADTARGAQAKAIDTLSGRLQRMEDRLAAIEARPATTPDGAPAPAIDPAKLIALESQIAELRSQLGGLETKVAALAAMPPAAPRPAPAEGEPVAAPPEASPVPPPGMDVTKELETLDRRLGAIEDTLPAPEIFTALDRRISELENADPMAAQRNAALALIVARLTQAVDEGRPFDLELAALQEASPGLIDAAALQPYAQRGLPPVPVLAARLETLDRDIRAAADEDRGGDWLDRLWRGIASLVVVRNDGEAQGAEPEDRLERALWRARAGDLRGAESEIGALTGRAGEAASVWLGDARARLAVEASLDAATGLILQDLARTGP